MVSLETLNAEPIHHNGFIVTPQSQAITLRLPIPHQQSFVGLVWNRPVAVLVQEGAETTRIPIYNLNRLIIIIMFGLSTLFFLSLLLIGKIAGKLIFRSAK